MIQKVINYFKRLIPEKGQRSSGTDIEPHELSEINLDGMVKGVVKSIYDTQTNIFNKDEYLMDLDYSNSILDDQLVQCSQEEYLALRLGSRDRLMAGVPSHPSEVNENFINYQNKLDRYLRFYESGRFSERQCASYLRGALLALEVLEKHLIKNATDDKIFENSEILEYLQSERNDLWSKIIDLAEDGRKPNSMDGIKETSLNFLIDVDSIYTPEKLLNSKDMLSWKDYEPRFLSSN